MLERLIAVLLALPFLLLAIAAWRFYAANPGLRERQPRDYVRETLDRLPSDRADRSTR